VFLVITVITVIKLSIFERVQEYVSPILLPALVGTVCEGPPVL
jgi:hypothetical protein